MKKREANVELDLRYLGALVDIGPEGVSEFDRPCLGSEPFEEFIIDARLDKDTRAGTAALPVVPAGEASVRDELSNYVTTY